ncbi:MAG: nicotinamide riboside transporter PnuC [Bernardetiaceae bacterium]|jgi:nicotinamide mononucleotide transporter|nr:nicotinamide riboside transporter PnuC [Bernardetiaceae bacterium]
MEVLDWGRSIAVYFAQNPVEGVGAGLTLLGIWLNVRQSLWGWVLGLGAIGCYLYVFFQARLYADVLLNLAFLVTSLYGLWHWKFGAPTQGELPVTRLRAGQWGLVLSLGAAGALGLGATLSHFTAAQQPWFNAATASYSLVAQWLLARKVRENWLLWAGVDVAAAGVYHATGLYATALLYALLAGLAVNGWRAWGRANG